MSRPPSSVYLYADVFSGSSTGSSGESRSLRPLLNVTSCFDTSTINYVIDYYYDMHTDNVRELKKGGPHRRVFVKTFKTRKRSKSCDPRQNGCVPNGTSFPLLSCVLLLTLHTFFVRQVLRSSPSSSRSRSRISFSINHRVDSSFLHGTEPVGGVAPL